jgi:hypothetical protein
MLPRCGLLAATTTNCVLPECNMTKKKQPPTAGVVQRWRRDGLRATEGDEEGGDGTPLQSCLQGCRPPSALDAALLAAALRSALQRQGGW